MNLLAKLRAMAHEAAPAPKIWAAVKDGPGPSPDLTRVLALPRRQLEATQELADKWTERLKRPGGTMRLRPIQAAALEEAYQTGGLLGLIGVGFGKTLISLLLPTVWNSPNAALLVPPNLKTKLFDLEYPELSKHWKLPNLVGAQIQYTDTKAVLHAVSFSSLSSAKFADVLERLQPDVVVVDECHGFRHASAARTKRFKRYFPSARVRPAYSPTPLENGTPRKLFAGLSGSVTSGALNDFAHLAAIALGKGAPVPLDWHTIQEWGCTLDASDFPAPAGQLQHMCAPGESVRSGFRRRLVETPGIVATSDNAPGMSLVFSRAPLKAPKAVLEALEKVRATWCRPDGEILREAIEVYAVTRQLSCGFFYRRTYPRQEPAALIREWSDARKDYFSEVRERLSHSLPGQDSPLLLWNAAKDGKWRSEHWARWAEVREAVKPDKETVWIDRFLVDAAVEWAQAKPGIVWVESEAVKAAFQIAKEAGIPVYTGGKEDEAALIREDGSRSVVAGINAFNAGVNLQAFNRNLITTSPASGSLLEQVIGRTHRPGQTADEVTTDFFQHTPELVSALKDAREKAKAIEETTGNRQKLCVGTWLF